MKTTPITPADFSIDAGADPLPDAATFDTPRGTPAQALQQTQRVYVQDHGLPARWQGRARWVVLDTGFGLGHRFLATWQAWRLDPQRCERLFYVVVEKHPPRAAHLARAHAGSPLQPLAEQLQRAWPPLTPNLHSLVFDGGHVQLLLAWGDGATLLPVLHLQADAFNLGDLSALNGAQANVLRWAKALGRKAAPGATLVAASADPAVQAALISAGFEARQQPVESSSGLALNGVWARYAPRFVARTSQTSAATPAAGAAGPRSAVVVGAGLAGAAVARALAQQGLQVTVLETQGEPASQASGNGAGLFHGTVNGDDGLYARLFRAAALAAAREYALALQPCAGDVASAGGTSNSGPWRTDKTPADASPGQVSGQVQGLLRLDLRPGGLPAMQALLQRQRWPADYVQALSAQEASSKAGLQLSAPAWFYPAGGWVSPPQWVRFALGTPGVRLRVQSGVQALRRCATGWQVGVVDSSLHGSAQDAPPLSSPRWLQADVVVLAHTHAADALLQTLGHAPLPLLHTSGQVTHLAHEAGAGLKMPVAGDGYALPLPFQHDGLDLPGLLCGATRHEGVPAASGLPPVTSEDHQINLQRLQRLLGIQQAPESARCSGRTGWRLSSSDRLPIAGAVPCVQMPPGQRMDQARLLPREPGLFVLTALGARGLTLAPLLAQLVAAQACGLPWPLEQDLVDAIDPARWRVRAARRAAQD